MIYLQRKPSPPLAECVEMLWYACAPHVPHQRELVLPGGKIQFVISLASDHLTDCTPAGETPTAPALLVGARTSAELIATRDMKQLAGVVFRPGGLGPWLRERADLFYEQSLFACRPVADKDLARTSARFDLSRTHVAQPGPGAVRASFGARTEDPCSRSAEHAWLAQRARNGTGTGHQRAALAPGFQRGCRAFSQAVEPRPPLSACGCVLCTRAWT